MESYIFRTKCETIGYFQKNGDICRICIQQELFPDIKTLSWTKWISYKDQYSSTLPDTTLSDPISSAISYFVWTNTPQISPNIIELTHSSFKPGEYGKRICRNSIDIYKITHKEASAIDEVRSYYNLFNELNVIFNVIEPDTVNTNTYGHRIRELLTIACTEVEYLLLQILKDNGYESSRYSTNDYVKVLPILRLNEYIVKLKMHPLMGTFSPFENWNSSNPTQSLHWYAAYNAAKHDRGGNFHQATLGATINAIAAVHILLEAQYGNNFFSKPLYSEFESCFQSSQYPTWTLGEIFAPLIKDNEICWKSSSQIKIK